MISYEILFNNSKTIFINFLKDTTIMRNIRVTLIETEQ